MKTNELIYDKALKKMLFEYIEKLDGFIINTSGYPTSNCQTKGEVNDVFFKKLNTTKIKKLYSGDYLSLFNEYYNLLQGKVKTNKIIALLYKDNDIFEFSQLIDKEKFLDNANVFQWDDISNLFDIILLEINACVNYNKSSKIKLGIETAIWNFTIDGILFDLDPPKILKKTEDTSFTRKEDINHIKRTIYRSFDETGMKINLLVTLILGEKHNSFIIKNKPDNYLIILLKKILDSYTKEDDRKKLVENLYNGVSANEMFVDHPIEILRRELMMREQSMNKEIVFVAGTSESGKSGGINYLKDKYDEIQHIKIRDVFPKVYEDTQTNLSFEEWQDVEEKRDLNNFWRLFVNKVYEMANPEKSIIILDTMYGVDGMIELYKILGDKVNLLYIDAPFNDRVMREYLRLRTDSPRGTRKADLSVTIEDVVERTIKKDKKKNSRGANKLKELRYSADYKSLEIGGLGEQFTYLINNDSNIDNFYSALDKYINHIKNKSTDKSDVELQKRLKK